LQQIKLDKKGLELFGLRYDFNSVPKRRLHAEIRAGSLRLLTGVVYRASTSGPVFSILDCLSQFCLDYDNSNQLEHQSADRLS
jgi:hypothetical protein